MCGKVIYPLMKLCTPGDPYLYISKVFKIKCIYLYLTEFLFNSALFALVILDREIQRFISLKYGICVRIQVGCKENAKFSSTKRRFRISSHWKTNSFPVGISRQ